MVGKLYLFLPDLPRSSALQLAGAWTDNYPAQLVVPRDPRKEITQGQ